MDLLLAVPLFIACFIPFGFVALSNRRRGAGLGISRAERVGRNGQLFDQLRLGVKESSAVSAASPWAMSVVATTQTTTVSKDGTVPAVIAGMPLLVNVIRGEMSLVGPLAQDRRQVDSYDNWHRARLRTTPGITGLWAVHGRSDLTFDEMVRLDLFYAEHWSPWLDMKVLIRSIPLIWTKAHDR